MKGKLRLILSVFFISFILSVIVMENGFRLPAPVTNKLPLLVTVFVSIVIQALPFILIAVFGSALIQMLITVEMVENKLARAGKLSGILLAIGAGFLFPVCDCGIIPLARRLLYKGVPTPMTVAFLITAPLVNPITVWATATAFGYNPVVTLIRVALAILVGIIVALAVGRFLPNPKDLLNSEALQEMELAATDESLPIRSPQKPGFATIFSHANEEFLEVGKFLVVGAFIAATIQTFLPKQFLYTLTQNPVLSILTMMALALCLSLCAEADAFVARSFTYHFPMGSVMAFMVFGQMIDIKNTALLVKSFKVKAILLIFGLCAILVFFGCLCLNIFSVSHSFWGRL